MAAGARTVQIGARPLRIALGAGHRNASGGNPFEMELNGRVCRAIVELARASDGFDVRCYTPDDGLGVHPGAVDAGPREVAAAWDKTWPVDVFHEVHAHAVPARTEVRGVFVVYPDGAGLASDVPNPGEVDADVVAHGPTMAGIISAATGLPIDGPGGRGIVSERQTLVGSQGRRLRIFAATATPSMVAHSCRFISEVGCHTNPLDIAIMVDPSFPRQEAVGILCAYASLAVAQMSWSYVYRIARDDQIEDASGRGVEQ
jgi:hypothetical protein